MLHRSIKIEEPEYPTILREIQDPPETLFIRGELASLRNKCLSIVGTRKASREGMHTAEEFAFSLARLEVTIISGLAAGIDAVSHKGALRAGGNTVAVLGTGIDKIYPAQNQNLAQEIIKSKGAILSEYPPGEPSYKGNFLRRNRIISGLSSATLVVEAPARSGSLATARFAAEQGREVFVVPGPHKNFNFAGSHALIRDGAILTTSPVELAQDMNWLDVGSKEGTEPQTLYELNPEETIVFETIHREGASLKVDKIIELTKLEPRTVNVCLASLIIKELVLEEGTGYKLK
ncbi:MAG: DNA-protecting protein DprA [Candidatus Colwellbacteria bacterium CG10_big_fil_rev_8_21_14_0_10_42_22]|uniref:DNA-protecting protein DprA n=1 Tax=Candidatus Colwellbacteria bacterium CG10_big_fil_rev_8_21_14_0_10_42_22 TaxID=1974540 RepID=A0A2H0VFZ9_9BACT|nr:MAG: DNA-protecting protein DprA [Candidatus Colwellbacteria bacterium CG10_big_fil_rev_8_21_14_0_10_42_22]